MKAISLWQPWATLWLLSEPDEKLFETRSWPTSYRGPLLVHAGLKRDGDVRACLENPLLIETLWERHGLRVADLAFGSIIGRLDLVECRQMVTLPEPSAREALWGRWEPERYGWRRGPNPTLFDVPVPYRGLQGLFDVPEAAISASRCSAGAPLHGAIG